METENSVDLLR